MSSHIRVDFMGNPILERLVEHEKLFGGKKILVIGDIALDRTFRCSRAPEGVHATHGAEIIYDVLDGADDYGAVGASNNSLEFCSSLHGDSTLVTMTGTDPEGDRVEQILRESGRQVLTLRLPDVQTVTRLRFFVLDRGTNRFNLLYRFDKDPDIPIAYAKSEQWIREGDFLDRFEAEVATSDVLLFNDTDKGFLSAGVLAILGERIERAVAARTSRGLRQPIVVVDPKVEWDKYKGLRVDVLKPNHIEASKALGLPLVDPGKESDLKRLGETILARCGETFSKVVVTLGPIGAIVFSCRDKLPTLILHPALPSAASQSGAATHCGDMFGTALCLSLSLTDDLHAAVDFANYAGSLQFSKRPGEKLSMEDLVASTNVDHFRRHCQEPRLIAAL